VIVPLLATPAATIQLTVFNALFSNTIGYSNTAIGGVALWHNTTGSRNTATGHEALWSNTTGHDNTATGESALLNNTTGDQNTAIGSGAIASNTTGEGNTATGGAALVFNTTGNENTATGFLALFSNTSGNNNTATGYQALYSNTDAGNNTAAGYNALYNNTTGTNNTATGESALLNNTTGSKNIALGDHAGARLTAGSHNIDIGNVGVPGESNTIRIGTGENSSATFVAGISGTTVATGVGVIINSNGRLGTITSSARFKDEIRPMDNASESILALQPVTFRYKKELGTDGIPQFGLVAEDVEKVNPDLVARDEQGKPYTVRYEAVNAMLLNEFLKEHRKVEELEATVANLQGAFKKQAALIQKVSDRLEVSKTTPQMVAENQ